MKERRLLQTAHDSDLVNDFILSCDINLFPSKVCVIENIQVPISVSVESKPNTKKSGTIVPVIRHEWLSKWVGMQAQYIRCFSDGWPWAKWTIIKLLKILFATWWQEFSWVDKDRAYERDGKRIYRLHQSQCERELVDSCTVDQVEWFHSRTQSVQDDVAIMVAMVGIRIDREWYMVGDYFSEHQRANPSNSKKQGMTDWLIINFTTCLQKINITTTIRERKAQCCQTSVNNNTSKCPHQVEPMDTCKWNERNSDEILCSSSSSKRNRHKQCAPQCQHRLERRLLCMSTVGGSRRVPSQCMQHSYTAESEDCFCLLGDYCKV